MATGRDSVAVRHDADRQRCSAQAIAEHVRKRGDAAGRVNFDNKFIYYVGPVDPVREEVIGPAGPTTATRMDKFTGSLLEHTGLIGMIGKAERGQIAIDAIKAHGAVYLRLLVGSLLVSKAIREAGGGLEDLGMEAIHEFVVDEMPVTVAVDVNGESVHRTGPAVWRRK